MKLLSWNIQAAIATQRYSEYLTRVHRQVLHTQSKLGVLETIAREIRDADIICLQEVDLGGRRSGYRSQVEIIAEQSGHEHVAVQENRVVRGVSRHGNAILSKYPISNVQDLKLPGRVRGRGCLIGRIKTDDVNLTVASLHLSLGAADQHAQLAHVAEYLPKHGRWLAMGDFNCAIRSDPVTSFLNATGATTDAPTQPTYPSWRPTKDYDHNLYGHALNLSLYHRGEVTCSDHLSITAKLEL